MNICKPLNIFIWQLEEIRIWLVIWNSKSSHFEYLNQVGAHAARCTKSALVAFVLSIYDKNNTELYLQKTKKLCNVVLCRSRVISMPGDYFLGIMSHNVYLSVVFRWQTIQPQFQYREMCHSSGASIFLGTKNIRAWVEIIVSHQCETSFWPTVLGIKEMHKQIHSTNNNFYVCLLLNKIS